MRDDNAYLIDIVEHARLIRDEMARLTRADYDADVLKRMGLVHLLQIIGEASRQVSEETRLRFPGVPWRQIVGMRHRIVHEYLRTDFDLVWDTASESIPELLIALEPNVGPMIDRIRKGNPNP